MVDGRPIQLAILGVEEAFGEMSMIDDQPRSATVTAMEPTVVRQITREGFFHALQRGVWQPGATLFLPEMKGGWF